MNEIAETGFWNGETAHNHHVHSENLSQWIYDFCLKHNINTATDFGCGLGEYLAKLSPILSDSPKREIIIRLAHPHEVITTLDGEILELSTSDLVIADHKQPLALAGIKGGQAAEITQQTQNIVLESANFYPTLIRRASKKIKITTSSP